MLANQEFSNPLYLAIDSKLLEGDEGSEHQLSVGAAFTINYSVYGECRVVPKGVCFISNIEVFVFLPKMPELDEEKI